MRMSRYISDNHVKNLPDAFAKTTGSNNYKILEVERLTVEELRDNLQDVFNTNNLDNCSGKTLDLYGDTVGQPRGVATDEQYILMIKSKIMRNVSNGSYRSIVNSICATFDCEASQVYIVEKDEPCVVELVVLPLSVINKAGLTTTQTIKMIKTLMPVCVTLESFLFEGTFCFSDVENEVDNDAGFTDVEGGQTGGFFGILYGEDNEPILPI